MLRNKIVTLTFLLPKDVSFMIRIKIDTLEIIMCFKKSIVN